jgi:hypothetical protein
MRGVGPADHPRAGFVNGCDESRADAQSQHRACISGGKTGSGEQDRLALGRQAAAGQQWSTGGAEEDVMHPMFVKLYLEPEADDLLADEQEKRRSAKLARRHRSRMAVRVTTPAPDRRPRR